MMAPPIFDVCVCVVPWERRVRMDIGHLAYAECSVYRRATGGVSISRLRARCAAACAQHHERVGSPPLQCAYDAESV